MNSVFNRYKTGIISLLILSGCVKELDPENNGYVAKPVVWAILNPDSTVIVETSGNKGLEDKDIVNITGMDMVLYENGVQVDQLLSQNITSENQKHQFKIKPVNNAVYLLKMNNQNIEISGTVILPNKFLKPDEINLTQGDNAQLTYTITDDENFIDAYQFTVEMFHFGVLTDTTTNDTLNKNSSFKRNFDKFEEPALNFNFFGLTNTEPDVYTFPITDNLFNGKKKTFLFTLQNPVTSIFFRPRADGLVSDKLICKKQYILIKCRKISPDYYKFLISENKNNSIFGTPYFNPSNVYTNINGGLGLLGGVVERTDTVWIKK